MRKPEDIAPKIEQMLSRVYKNKDHMTTAQIQHYETVLHRFVENIESSQQYQDIMQNSDPIMQAKSAPLQSLLEQRLVDHIADVIGSLTKTEREAVRRAIGSDDSGQSINAFMMFLNYNLIHCWQKTDSNITRQLNLMRNYD